MKARQMRDSPEPVPPMFLPTTGRRPAFTRSPNRWSIAGRSVSAAATDTMPTMTAPAARLRRMFVGTRNMPNSAITNVEPLNSTARLAVADVRWMAVSLSRPAARSSRNREMTKSE